MPRRPNDTVGFSNRSTSMMEGLESRQLMAAASSDTIIAVKIAKRVDTAGNSMDSNRITIGFSSNITLSDAAMIRSFGYANDTLTSSSQKKVTVGLSVTASANVLTIITDRLIRKGSRLFIYSGAITDSSGKAVVFDASTTAKTITFTTGQNKPRYTLSNRAFRPSDASYFDPAVFSASPAPTTANTTPSASTVRASLVAFLGRKVSAGTITSAQETSALATYDSSATAGYIPNANLRAALVSLTGTVAASAIQTILGKSNVTGKSWTLVDFGSSSDISVSAPTAETKLSTSGRLQTLVRDTFSGESFEALSAILAREALHQGTVANPNGNTSDAIESEVVDNAVANTVYAQQLLTDPTPAGNGTKLVTYLNTQLLALLNSGQKLFPYGGINAAALLTTPANVFIGAVSDPGGFGNSTPVTSFADFIRRDFTHRGLNSGAISSTPYAVTVLKNIVGSSGDFTQLGANVETYLDTRNTILTDVAYIKLATALKLTF